VTIVQKGAGLHLTTSPNSLFPDHAPQTFETGQSHAIFCCIGGKFFLPLLLPPVVIAAHGLDDCNQIVSLAILIQKYP